MQNTSYLNANADTVSVPSQPTTTAPAQPTTTAPSQPTTTAPSQPTTTAPSQPTNTENVLDFFHKDGYLYVRIPNYGNEKDLMQFYTIEYFNMVGLSPTIYINNIEQLQTQTRQTGGGDMVGNSNITVPYVYISNFLDVFFKIKPIDNEKVSFVKEEEPKKETSTQFGFMDIFNKPPTTTKTENVPFTKIPTIAEINPVKTETPKGELFDKTTAFGATPTQINPPTAFPNATDENGLFKSTPTPVHSPILSSPPIASHTQTIMHENSVFDFNTSPTPISQTTDTSPPPSVINHDIMFRFENENIVSLEELMKNRDVALDIDISPNKFKYEELEKLIQISEKKNTEIYLEEIFIIDNALIVFKGGVSVKEKTQIELKEEMTAFT
jgi:hypothetical protein